MNFDWQSILAAAKQHIPEDAAWLPVACLAAVGLLGLLLFVKGARLAPAFVAILLLAAGGLAGTALAPHFGTPVLPTAAAAGVIGLTAGLVLFKLWLALLMAGIFVTGSLALYSAQMVIPRLPEFGAHGYVAEKGAMGVHLPESDAAALPDSNMPLVFWHQASQTIPNFQTSVWAIVISTTLAGLLVGFLLPRFSRALFAATGGIFLMGFALFTLLKTFWPSAADWLLSLGAWGWVVLLSGWCLSLVVNFYDCRRRKIARRSEPEEESAPAVAA